MPRFFMQGKMDSYIKQKDLYNNLHLLYVINKKKHFNRFLLEEILYFCTFKLLKKVYIYGRRIYICYIR